MHGRTELTAGLSGGPRLSVTFSGPFSFIFLNKDNAVYLLPHISRTLCGSIYVVCLIYSFPRSPEPGVDIMLQNDFRRISVLFIHCKEKEREHDGDHDERCRRSSEPTSRSKKERYADKNCRPETQELACGKVQEDLAFDPRQVARNICIQIFHIIPFLVSIFSSISAH